jgi:hypothetical protein
MEHLPEASAGAAAKDKSVGASLNGSTR